MKAGNRIVGICLVRNEERFLDLVLTNIVGFCDQILIADNGSTDRTPEIARRWAVSHPSVNVSSIGHPRESHTMLLPFINTPTWIFAVDGDEIYDPQGLARLREPLVDGAYDRYWRIIGNVLNCRDLDMKQARARGYLSPPSRSITKLYNFNAIYDWSDVPGERLHGGIISFNAGYREDALLRWHDQVSWDEAVFRCLHLCFLPRSSKDGRAHDGMVTRWNLAEQQGRGILTVLAARLLRLLGSTRSSQWKKERYGRGELVEKDIAAFLPDSCRKSGFDQSPSIPS
ncbi:MAG: hypothetical protein F9K32_02085 [Desulfobulbaceae bacterium]|nr:MAG: hypothetical protein F9K32_02085 [Desulfobulbaceae bacterium]